MGLELGDMVASVSAVRSADGRPVTRSSSGYGSFLVPEEIRMSLGPYSTGLVLG